MIRYKVCARKGCENVFELPKRGAPKRFCSKYCGWFSWRRRNPRKARAQVKRYYWRNVERMRERCRIYMRESEEVNKVKRCQQS